MNTNLAPLADLHMSSEAFAFEQVSMEARQQMAWSGTAAEVVASACAGVESSAPLEHGFWVGARLVRAVVDHATDPHRAELVGQATTFAMDWYLGQVTQDKLDRLASGMERAGILDAPIQQPYDIRTFMSTLPETTRAASERLVARASGRLLVMPLCHGGLVAGLQLVAQSGLQKVQVHPVRFSQSSHKQYGDKQPHVSKGELTHLLWAARFCDDLIVIDEDAQSGDSLHRAVRFLRDKRLVSGHVSGFAVHDGRNPQDRRRQGEYWEL